MIREIKCGNETVRLKNTCGFLLHYANQFNSDAIKDIFTAFGGIGKYTINITIVMQVIWAMAKEAGSTELPEEFYKRLENINAVEAIALIFDAVTVDDLESAENSDSEMTTYSLLSCAVRIGLTVNDFKEMTLNTLLRFFAATAESYQENNDDTRVATQADFDMF